MIFQRVLMTNPDLIHAFSQLYKTPRQVQKLLRSFNYNRSPTLASAETCLLRKSAHCLEGVFVAAALLEPHGYEPLVLSFESQDGLDHCLFIFQFRGRWGAVGKSRDEGLNGRAPIFRSLKNLVWSYFDPYVDGTGRITGWQVAHLDETGSDWRRSSKSVWKLEQHLLTIEHHPLNSSEIRYQNLLMKWNKGHSLPRPPYWW